MGAGGRVRRGNAAIQYFLSLSHSWFPPHPIFFYVFSSTENIGKKSEARILSFFCSEISVQVGISELKLTHLGER